jgi:hypothetical protein
MNAEISGLVRAAARRNRACSQRATRAALRVVQQKYYAILGRRH